MNVPQLKRLRWGVRAVLTVGVAASVTANVLHALPNPISQAIAAWPPLALLATIELISRIPVHRRSVAITRLVATATIAGIAAWVSYWHMAGVASRYGETGASPYLLPLSVDGLVVVASVCLVELAGRLRLAATEPATEQPVATSPQPASDQPAAEVATGHIPLASGQSSASRPPRERRAGAGQKPAVATGQRPLNEDTLATIAQLRAADPAITQKQVATRIGKGLRTVGGYWPATEPSRANGRVPDLAST